MISRLLLSSRPGRWLERNTQLLLRLLVAGTVLLLSAYWAPRASQRQLILALGAVIALVFLRWPPLGLMALIPASLIVPFAIGTGSNTSLHAGVLLLSLLTGLWVLEMIAHQRRVWLASSRPILPLLIFLVIAVLAFLGGQLPWFPLAPAPMRAQIAGLAIFLLSGGAFLLVAHQIRDIYWLKWLTWIFLALGALYVMGRLAPGLGRFADRLFQNGVFNHSLFWTWLVALAFSQATFNRRLHLHWRLLLGGLVLAAFWIGLFQTRWWAAGWLPPLVAVVTILWVGAPHLRLLATLASGAVVALDIQKVIGLVMINEQYSAMTRWEAWRILAEIVKVNPVLGLGPANYYYYTPLYPILGWYVQFNSHNQYVDIIAQTGLLGLACFLWFIWEVGRLGWRLRTRVPVGFAQAYVYAALGGLVGTLAAAMIGDWVLPFVYNVGLVGFRSSVLGWLFLGGLVTLEQMALGSG